MEDCSDLYWQDRAACAACWEALILDRQAGSEARLQARMESVRVLLETHLQDALVHAAFLLAETEAEVGEEGVPAAWAYNRGVLALQQSDFARAFEYLGRAAIAGGDTVVRARTTRLWGATMRPKANWSGL
ncbi:MAG: hypothetical protein HC918_01975 [Oscillatoriales cyanobacterium SM2_1_8]|nr:hypothetical protein [Oscillatoriales cyanobacterium SM2_1_8]